MIPYGEKVDVYYITYTVNGITGSEMFVGTEEEVNYKLFQICYWKDKMFGNAKKDIVFLRIDKST